MGTTRTWSRRLAVVGATLLAACADSGGSASPDPPSGSVVASPAGSTSDPPPATASPDPPPATVTASPAVGRGGATTAEACPVGEYPAVGAFDLGSGVVAWATCSPEEAHRTMIGASADVVLVEERSGPARGATIALDATDGTERWRRSSPDRSGRVPRGPVDGHGIVVVVTDDEGPPAVVGLDAKTGEERWREEGAATILGQSTDVVVVAGKAAPGFPPAVLRGIEREGGKERWTSAVLFNNGWGTVWEGTVIVPTVSMLAAIEIDTGEVRWTGPLVENPEAADGVVVAATPSEEGPQVSLDALDADTGDALWSAPGQPSYGDLLAMGDEALVVLDREARALVAYELASGEERWRTPPVGAAEPQLIDGIAVVLLWEGELAVVSSVDGSTTWSAQEPLHSPLMNSVTTNGTTLFVAVNSLPWGD